MFFFTVSAFCHFDSHLKIKVLHYIAAAVNSYEPEKNVFCLFIFNFLGTNCLKASPSEGRTRINCFVKCATYSGKQSIEHCVCFQHLCL